MPWQVEASNGIHLPQIGWHLDASRRARQSFVSHAHADHIARHETVICTSATARLMAARLGGKRHEIHLPFGEIHVLPDGTRVTLHPAGHVLGSAQFHAENEHGSILYTGDFKLRAGRSAELCATPRADTVIMETTFGRPRYVFPPDEEVRAAMVKFCHDAMDARAVPVFFAYSLGKTQEVLATLAGSNLPVMLLDESWKMTRLYEQLGASFPPYARFDAESAMGHVVIGPPQNARSVALRRLPARRTAIVSGWALDRSTIFRSKCDAAFPLSDHAGYDDLLRFVERVQPTRVFTVHGFAGEFAADLRSRGIEAWALGRANQLEFPLPHG